MSEAMYGNRQRLDGRILTPQGWVNGVLRFDQRILRLDAHPGGTSHNGPYILPGFIDLHIHGGAGADIMEGGDAALKIARLHAQHGTTALLATTMTAPEADIRHALHAVGLHCRGRAEGSARLLGVHLEGPYLNPGKLGAQPDAVCLAMMQQLESFNALAPLRVVTLAPELPGHHEVIRQLSARDIRAQIGHTLGSYQDGVDALQAGASGFTHLFNAMPGLHHRQPGMVGAALAHAEYAELIPDLIHIHPGAIRVAARSIPHLYCVTDSTAAAGMPDGEYALGSQRVNKCLGGVRLADGSLAGSCLTMDQALRNLVAIGFGLAEASHYLSRNPARYLGLTDRGCLAVGAWADVVVLDEKLVLQQVFVEGEHIHLSDGGAT